MIQGTKDYTTLASHKLAISAVARGMTDLLELIIEYGQSLHLVVSEAKDKFNNKQDSCISGKSSQHCG